MYKYHHDHLPPIFSDFYVQNNLVHDYHTRQENLLHVPLIRTAPLSKSVRVTGVSLYNHFRNLICLRVSYVTYKYNLKRHILDNTTLNLVKTLWIKFPWYIMCYFNDFQCVTMEASLCKDKWLGTCFGIFTGERVEMAESRSLPQYLCSISGILHETIMGVSVQQHFSGGGKFISQTLCHNWGDSWSHSS